MRRNIILSLSTLLLLAGCALNGPEPIPTDEALSTVHFKIDFAGMSGTQTRSLAPGYSFSDGKSVSILKGYIYNQATGSSSNPVKIVDIDINEVEDKRGGDIILMLPKGQVYDVVFLGTSIEQSNPDSKLYYNKGDRTLSIDYSKVSGNDEELDCFFAAKTDVTTDTALEETIELKRPFAQLNIGTQDYDEYNSSTPVSDISVSVEGIYNKVDLMTGQVIGDQVDVTISGATIPTGQIYPVKDYSYLSMNYLLVGLRKLVNVGITVNHLDGTPAKTVTIENVAVERNYQTNVFGKTLLTKELPTE